ncbi:MAG: pilus assembly protein PilY [Pseudomonadota bacterium]
MKTTLLKGALAAGMLTAHLLAPAADLDLYANPPLPVDSINTPNVLFIIDNTSNWHSHFTAEMSALANVLHNLPVDKFKVGFMMDTETGNGNSNVDGGYVRAAIRPMNAANKTKYEAMVRSFADIGDRANGGRGALQMAEAWRYFKGGTVYAGNGKVKTDYHLNVAGTVADRPVWALDGNAIDSKTATTYHSPLPTGSCAKNFIIYISNGKNQLNTNSNGFAKSILREAASAEAGGGAAGTAAANAAEATINIGGGGSQDDSFDEWAHFMKSSSLGVTTFAVEIDVGHQNADLDYTAMLKSAAGDNYVATDSSGGGVYIEKALNDALSKIQSVNSVFAAVSLPASANVQGAYLNQLYVGMFRPDESSFPRWLGNLKQYKLGTASNLVDQDNNNAINTGTGFIAACARSFWTPDLPTAATPDNYWAQAPQSLCIPASGSLTLYANANSPDGNIVEKGAQGFRLRRITPANRKVYSCSAAALGCNALVELTVPADASNGTTVATAAALGVPGDNLARNALIAYARGVNNQGELHKTLTEMRPSAHGDVIHSNPLALSYGDTDTTSNVIVYYGSNDGMLHAINGNRSASFTTTGPGAATYAAGDELWSFLPPEFFGQIKRLRDNTVKVAITKTTATIAAELTSPPPPTVPPTPAPLPKPYSIDGPISTYREGSTTSIYATMRRGGRAVYAFNVTTPTAPELLWKSGCGAGGDTDCKAGASAIGQTWSTARPTKIVDTSITPVVLIMGGGYDNCEDPDVNTCGAGTSKGANIMVLSAANGDVLQVLPTDRGVVGDVRIVPDANGKALYGYAADLGGNLYRINIGALAPGAWTITKIASLGCPTPSTTASSCTSNRKFMFAPSVIPELDGSYSLYIGTGDREKPLSAAYFPRNAEIANYFFKVKDDPTDATWLTSEHETCGADVICLATLSSTGDTDATTTATCGVATAPTGKGWALRLRAKEQVVTVAATRFGITTFSTHMPEVPVDGACTAKLGTVHVYNLDITNAKPAAGYTCNDEVTGGGLPPPPEKMDVCIDDACTATKSICIGCSKVSSIQSLDNSVAPTTLGSNAKRRVYWYIQK